MIGNKKTFAGISKKFRGVLTECEALEKQAGTELEILAVKQEELDSKVNVQEAEQANAKRLGSNLKKMLEGDL